MCAAITLGSASWSTSFGGCSPSSASTYIFRVDCMPPMPVPWVLANFVGWIQRSSSAGSKPLEMNASTVATRFHAASRSTDSVIEPRPHTFGSNPSGTCAPTKRESLNRRGTRIWLPASRVTSQSPSSVGAMRVCFGVGLDEGVGLVLGAYDERGVLLEEDRDHERRGVVDHRPVVAVAADADAAPRSARRTSRRPRPRSAARPTRRRASRRPAACSQTIRPVVHAELEHAGRGQVVLDLHLEAGARWSRPGRPRPRRR